MTENLKRDRDGEPFQDTFTENRGIRRPVIEEQSHNLDLEGDNVTGADAAATTPEPDREKRP